MRGFALDIDDTIADTSSSVVERMLSEFGHSSMDVKGIVKKYAYPSLVPEWQLPQHQSTLKKLHEDLDFYENIPPFEHVAEKVAQLAELAPIECYITSRLTSMYAITQSWLVKNNFPRAPVICRSPEVQEIDWKVRYLVQQEYTLLGLVDNELYVPGDVDFDFTLFELIQSQKVSPEHPKLILCESWDDLIMKIQEMNRS